MELSQIRYFILTAQLQNMSQAARVLNITQPTLSKSISNLEKELGTQLFDRSGKKLILNERGKRFLEGAIASVQELDNAAGAAQDHILDSTLHLGLFHVSGKLMSCVGDFMSQYPDVFFQIDYLEASSEDIDTNEFDMLLYPRSAHFRKYKGDTLYTESYFLAAYKSSPLASARTVSISDLHDQRLVFLKYNKDIYDISYHICLNKGISRNNHILTNSHEIQRHLISSGHGSGFVQAGCCGIYENDVNIELIPVTDSEMSQEIMIGFKREKHLSESGKLFSRYVLDYFKE